MDVAKGLQRQVRQRRGTARLCLVLLCGLHLSTHGRCRVRWIAGSRAGGKAPAQGGLKAPAGPGLQLPADGGHPLGPASRGAELYAPPETRPAPVKEEVQPAFSETAWWIFESCVGVGPVKMGVPGLAAQVFFFAPIPTMRKILRQRSTDRLPLLPFSAMLVNGFMWAAYGVLTDNPAIWAPNVVAFSCGLAYTSIFLLHCPAQANWLPKKRELHLLSIALFVGGTSACALLLPTEAASRLIGFVVCGVCVVMFAGPLAAIMTVLKEKSTRSLPLMMTIMTCANCSLWAFYGLWMIGDPFIYVPNVLGLMAGLVQASLFVQFGLS